MGALWRPLGLPHFLVCATRVLQWGSNKRQKQFKINGLGRFFGTLLGGPISTIPTKNTFPCSATLVFTFSGSVLMQRDARFWIFDVLLGGPTWPSEGVRSIYKPNGILHILEKIEKR